MALETILETCKTINAGISGVVASYAHSDVPDSLTTAVLPCAMALPYEGVTGFHGAGLLRTEHRVRIWIVGQPLGQASAEARLSELVPFEARLRLAYARAIKLNALGDVSHAFLDTYRFFVLRYAGNDYAALEYVLRVIEKPASTVEV